MKKQKSLGKQIQEAVINSGKSHYQISKEAELTGSTLQRVMQPDWGKQLDTAKKILNAINFDIRIIEK